MNACSFCSKPETDVKRLIAGGPGIFICERCIALCSTLIAQEAMAGIPKGTDTEPEFRITPMPLDPGAAAPKWTPPAPGDKPSGTRAAVPPNLAKSGSAATPPVFKPVPGREMPRFAGISTFFRLPVWEAVTGADVAILGIPLDAGTTYRPGARFAPREIRSASTMGRAYQTGTNADIFASLKICDAGDAFAIPTDLQKSFVNIEKRMTEILDAGAIPLSVGGDHSITLPILRAFKKSRAKLLAGKKPIAVVHFDAHLDTYPAAWGVDYHHGTPFRHLVEEGLVDPKKVIQIGIRGPLAEAADLDFAKKHGFEVVFIDEVREKGPKAIAAKFARLAGSPIYVSFDIDGLDPAYASGTGTPVPGGLTTYDCQVMLRALAGMDLVGFDIVEVSPGFDPSGVTNLVAVTMMQEWLGALAAGRKPRP